MCIQTIDFFRFEVQLPSEEELRYLSYKTQLNKSLKTSLSKVSKEDLFIDLRCAIKTLNKLSSNFSLSHRVKSYQSCELKYNKNISRGNSIKSTFNDLLGIRLIVQEYPKNYPEYFRVVDMRNGKKYDDGYRGVHLYYQLDNYHYPIEIQLNTKEDRLFADWSHIYCYKRMPNEEILKLRYKFDIGEIKNERDFVKEVRNYEKNNCS